MMKQPFCSISALFICMCLLSACGESPAPSSPSSRQIISGRNDGERRLPIYQVSVPSGWVRRDSLPEETLSDTTKPIVEFLIAGETGPIRISIHNFPSDTIEQRIPPSAQVARWQRQLEGLVAAESHTVPQAFGGFVGLGFKGLGRLGQIDSMVLGWSLQVGDHHYRMLSTASSGSVHRHREMRADVTIKAVGPKNFMEGKEEEITAFARSFELIEEIPSRS